MSVRRFLLAGDCLSGATIECRECGQEIVDVRYEHQEESVDSGKKTFTALDLIGAKCKCPPLPVLAASGGLSKGGFFYDALKDRK